MNRRFAPAGSQDDSQFETVVTNAEGPAARGAGRAFTICAAGRGTPYRKPYAAAGAVSSTANLAGAGFGFSV